MLFVEDTLYTGGDDGIFELYWPSQENAQIDSRSAAALEIVNDTLIAAGNPNAVFVVNGDSLGFDGNAAFTLNIHTIQHLLFHLAI